VKIAQYLFNRFLAEAGIFVLMVVMAVALCAFFLYHVYLTSYNMTTNESYKWNAVHKWYKRELKAYKRAVEAGDPNVVLLEQDEDHDNESKEGDSQGGVAVNDDGDVTCTPSGTGNPTTVVLKASKSEADGVKKSRNQHAIRHPGPKPRNVYDRGFVENWKEVLYPISLRENDGTTIASSEAFRTSSAVSSSAEEASLSCGGINKAKDS